MTRPLSTLMPLSVVALLATLGACASHPAAPPPGTQAAYSIDCSGSGQTWEDCYKKAQRACGQAYDVVSRSADTADEVKRDKQDAYGNTQVYRTLVVTCRKQAGDT